MIIIDSDVLIWYLRGNIKARDAVNKHSGFCISAVTYMELVQGIRNKHELMLLKEAIRKWGCRILYINEEISASAMFMSEQHYLSGALMLADALIAATAISSGAILLTGNVKHYRIIKNLSLEQFKP